MTPTQIYGVVVTRKMILTIPFEGSARTKAICFSTGKRGIITTGGSSGYYYDDTWELHPYEWEEDD